MSLLVEYPTGAGASYWATDLGDSGKRYGVSFESDRSRVITESDGTRTHTTAEGILQMDEMGNTGLEQAKKVAHALSQNYPRGI